MRTSLQLKGSGRWSVACAQSIPPSSDQRTRASACACLRPPASHASAGRSDRQAGCSAGRLHPLKPFFEGSLERVNPLRQIVCRQLYGVDRNVAIFRQLQPDWAVWRRRLRHLCSTLRHHTRTVARVPSESGHGRDSIFIADARHSQSYDVRALIDFVGACLCRARPVCVHRTGRHGRQATLVVARLSSPFAFIHND